jgi:hypothetical protein
MAPAGGTRRPGPSPPFAGGPAVVYPTPNFIWLSSGPGVHIWLAGTTIYTDKLSRHINAVGRAHAAIYRAFISIFRAIRFRRFCRLGSSLRHDDKGHRRATGQADRDRADHPVGGVGRAPDHDRHGVPGVGIADGGAMAPGDSMARLDSWATYTTSMRPVRPCSNLTAASRARLAGGEPSYPTTRCTNPPAGVAVVTVVKVSPGPGPAMDMPARIGQGGHRRIA